DGIRDRNVTGVQTCALPIFSTLQLIYNTRLPSMALNKVISSAYSISLPTDKPWARRVTLIPAGLIKRDKYIAVASPSAVALVAKIGRASWRYRVCTSVLASY